MYSFVYTYARERLDKHLPEEAEHNDQFKNMVFDRLSHAMIESFDWAKESLVIDGQDETESVANIIRLESKETVAPLDTEVNAELRKLINEVEQETIEVTRLRKRLPLELKRQYQDLLTLTDQEVSAMLNDIDNQVDEDIIEEDRLPKFEDMDALVDDYENSSAILSDLKHSISKTCGEISKIDETLNFLDKAYQQRQLQFEQ